MQWKRESLDMAELAVKRYLEKWSLADLSDHFGRSGNAVQWFYLNLRRKDFHHVDISQALRNKLVRSVKGKGSNR